MSKQLRQYFESCEPETTLFQATSSSCFISY